MSMGFLTESALLPSKSKPIKVDSTSILDLKAVVEQGERRLQDKGNDAGYINRIRGKRSRKQIDIFDRKNKGVEERNALEGNEGDEMEARLAASRRALELKAKRYEELMKRAPGTGSGGNPKDDSILIDFDKKKEQDAGTSQTIPDSSHKRQKMNEGSVGPAAAVDTNFVEIEDEFGRVRTVSRQSKEYYEYLDNQRRSAMPNDFVEPVVQGGVSSQWEHKLSVQEKQYLQQVSERTKAARSLQKDDRRAQRMDARRERLKNRHGSGSGSATSVLPAQNKTEMTPSTSSTAAQFLSKLASEL